MQLSSSDFDFDFEHLDGPPAIDVGCDDGCVMLVGSILEHEVLDDGPESGTSGRCSSCNQPIHSRHATGLPQAERCVDCQRLDDS